MTAILTHDVDVPQGDTLPPPGAVVLSDGTYIVQITIVAEDPIDSYYILQRYAADGTALGDPRPIASVQDDSLRIVALAEGYAVLDRNRYEDMERNVYFRDYFRVFSADGDTVAGRTFVTHYHASPPTFAQLDSGDLLFTWQFATIGNTAIFHVDGTSVSSQTVRSLYKTPITTVVDGGFVEVWFGLDAKTHGQFYDATGNPTGPGFLIAPIGPSNYLIDTVGATLTRWQGGGFIMTWNDYDRTINQPVVVVRTYDSAGLPVSEATQAGAFVDQPATVVTVLNDGGFVVTWLAGGGSAGPNPIYARRFDNTGHAMGLPVLVNGLAAGQVSIEGVTATADGGFTVKWIGFTDHWEHYSTAFSATTDMSGANLLFGTSGNDSLDGRQGADIMAGGVANDTYYVDNAGDQVQELAGAGIDWVYSLITYTLPTDVEILTLRGTADIDGYGNALNNRLAGNAGANHLFGGAGNDDLRALAGNDTLNGNSGADSLYGGAGDDLYYVDNAGDRVFETAAGDGTDTVRTSVDFALGANVENLALVGTDNLRGFGNELANTLTGNAGANILRGLDGNDRIDGGAGADSLIGGTGNDTYYVDNAGDKVYESAGEGTDRVYSSVTFAVNSQSIESVILTGSANINTAGGAVADQLTGSGGANILTGNAGSDNLNGGAGSDTLIGGTGSDLFTFSLDSGTDTISDFLSSDNDHIDLHAYSAGVVNGGGITVTQSGLDTIIDLGGGNIVTVMRAVATDVNSHIIW